MTDGTSQGLFIVVAIVIFGIFIVLAYILFEDTLSPAMANMFTNATETASKRLNNLKKLDNTLMESPTQHTGYITLDFERKYVDTGENFSTLLGEAGIFNSNVYDVNTKRNFYGRVTEFDKFVRVHVTQSWQSFESYNFVRKEVFVNGKKMDIKASVGKNPGANVAVHYLEFLDSPEITIGNPFTFKVVLHTDNNEYFEIEKTVIFQ